MSTCKQTPLGESSSFTRCPDWSLRHVKPITAFLGIRISNAVLIHRAKEASIRGYINIRFLRGESKPRKAYRNGRGKKFHPSTITRNNIHSIHETLLCRRSLGVRRKKKTLGFVQASVGSSSTKLFMLARLFIFLATNSRKVDVYADSEVAGLEISNGPNETLSSKSVSILNRQDSGRAGKVHSTKLPGPTQYRKGAAQVT
jgi:hypothetical protein